MTDCLDEALLTALRDFLTDEVTAHPPGDGEIYLLKVGKLQDNPEQRGASITFHVGDPQDAAWKHEAITEQARSGGGSTHRILGGYMELDESQFWWYRYSAVMTYFFTRSGDNRDVARRKALGAMKWLRNGINRAKSELLAIGTVENDTPVEINVAYADTREGGGPPNSFIWRGTVGFRVLTMVETPT